MNETEAPIRDMRIYGSLNVEPRPQKTPSAEEWERIFWSPRVLAHMSYEYSGKTPDGWGLHSFTEFYRTPAEIKIPVCRNVAYARESGAYEDEFSEMDALTDEQLTNEPYHQFYRHMDMLITFNERDRMRELAPAVIERIHQDGDTFAEELYKDDYSVNTIKRFSNLHSLCYLDTCAEDPSYTFSKEEVEKMFEDGKNKHGGYLQYAQEFDNRNAKEGRSVDIEGKIKEYMLPLLVSETEESAKKVKEILYGAV